MIYLTSDPHGGDMIGGIKRYMEIGTDGDLLIILGDVGLCFQDTEENRRFTAWFLSLDKSIAIVDGNHENHRFIQSFPSDIWCGGPVHRLSDTIVHLNRGHIYTIHDKTFFVMGGCKSSAKWKEMGLWHEGEEPTEAELSLAYETLRQHDHKIDYILTHKYVDYTQTEDLLPLTLEGLTKYIDTHVTFTHWYAGHRHVAQCIDQRHTLVYDELVKIF